jgi:hypothetical protein
MTSKKMFKESLLRKRKDECEVVDASNGVIIDEKAI